MEHKFKALHNIIGNTPLIEIEYKYLNKINKAYFKAEWTNFTGSIKDRMALSILENAYKLSKLKKDQPIVEISSGNTGISLSAMGKFLGNPVYIILPDTVSVERREIIKSYGAKLFVIGESDGGQKAREALKQKLIKEQNAFPTNQHSNFYNTKAHYTSTGPETYKQLQSINKMPTAFAAGVGTSGTIMGIGTYLKTKNNDLKVYGIEPYESPTIRLGYKKGPHKIQGLNAEFISPLNRVNKIDELIDIRGLDAVIMAQKLSNELGLGVGISAGANFLGAVTANYLQELNPVTISVFPDDNKKYLSTDLFKEIEVKDEYLSQRIELLDYNIIK